MQERKNRVASLGAMKIMTEICPMCKGSGKVPGEKDCENCRGSGKCIRCDGTGKKSWLLKSDLCKATGICITCNGTGKRKVDCLVCKGAGEIP